MDSKLSDELLIDEKKAARLIGFSTRALQAWRHRGGGPLFVRISSRAIRYRPKDLVTWAEEKICRDTSDLERRKGGK